MRLILRITHLDPIQPILKQNKKQTNILINVHYVHFIQNGRAEVCTEDAVSALRKAAKWASQMGLVVSTGPPADGVATETPAQAAMATDKKKMAADVVCKEKNIELAR